MNDYVDLRMFPHEGVDFLTKLDHPIFGVVSAQIGPDKDTTVRFHRDLQEKYKHQFVIFTVYGSVGNEEKLLLLLNAQKTQDTKLFSFLSDQARKIQSKFCFGYRDEPQCKCLVPDQDYLDGKDIPAFDGSADVFNDWAGNIYPGFQLKGYFPRNVLYIQKKLRLHKVQ